MKTVCSLIAFLGLGLGILANLNYFTVESAQHTMLGAFAVGFNAATVLAVFMLDKTV